jgi:hypothetical protein
VKLIGVLILGLGLMTGCESVPQTPLVRSTFVEQYEPSPSAALVFDPPMTRYAPVSSFSREGRSVSAFYGYEQPGVDIYSLYQRDSQRGEGYPDYFDRTTRSGRIIKTYR